MVQFYLQPDDGAINTDGTPMDVGWYYVAGEGAHVGPFFSLRKAEAAYHSAEKLARERIRMPDGSLSASRFIAECDRKDKID